MRNNIAKEKKKCLIIDGNNIVHRSYHASQKLAWLGENKEIYIFLKIFFSSLLKGNYEKLLIVFDEGRETFRNKMDKSYKNNRIKMPEQLFNFLGQVRNLLVECGLNYSSSKEFEADDLIASFVEIFSAKNDYEFHIFSQDKDLFQLLSDNVKLLRYNQGVLESFGPKEFFEVNKFPHQSFCYYLALLGDKSDNVKGVSGIGKKRASYLASQFQNLENTFQQIKEVTPEIRSSIEHQRSLIEKNIKMVSLVRNIPTKNWENYNFSWEEFRKNEKLIAFCKEKRFVRFLSYLADGTQSRIRTDTD